VPTTPTTLQYIRLHDSDVFNMGVFCFAANDVIPLHNHPHMTVMAKLLYGQVGSRSWRFKTARCVNTGE